MEFEWDSAKAASNLRKHGVDFEDALQVFFDPYRIESIDDSTDYGEVRWITLGWVDPTLLIMVFTVREFEGDIELYRLISARKADPKDYEFYGQILHRS